MNLVLELLMLIQDFPTFDMGPIQEVLDSLFSGLQFFYILTVRFYFLFIAIGFILYATTLHDSIAKVLVSFGIVAFFIGPFLVSMVAGFPMASVILADGDVLMLDTIGLSDGDVMFLVLTIGDLVAAICIIIGAIMYFTQPSREMVDKGQTLIVRSLILLSVILFFYSVPFL